MSGDINYQNPNAQSNLKLQFYPSAKMDKASKNKLMQSGNANMRGNSSNQILEGPEHKNKVYGSS